MRLANTVGVTPQELRARIERFADDVIAFCAEAGGDPLRMQLLLQLQSAATSAAANYRAACRAQSRPAFVAKLSIALEEADEAEGWLRRLSHLGSGNKATIERLLKEANELSAILNASRLTARGRRRR
jgi:four helix bundle protein